MNSIRSNGEAGHKLFSSNCHFEEANINTLLLTFVQLFQCRKGIALVHEAFQYVGVGETSVDEGKSLFAS